MSRKKLRAKLLDRLFTKSEGSLCLRKDITLKHKSIFVNVEDSIFIMRDGNTIIFQYSECSQIYTKRVDLDSLSDYDCSKILKNLCTYE